MGFICVNNVFHIAPSMAPVVCNGDERVKMGKAPLTKSLMLKLEYKKIFYKGVEKSEKD